MDQWNKTELINEGVPINETEQTNDLNGLYLELGKAYYEGAFEDPLPQLLPIFDQITGILAEKDKKMSEEPQILTCPNCGIELPDDAKFCGTCGTSIA